MYTIRTCEWIAALTLLAILLAGCAPPTAAPPTAAPPTLNAAGLEGTRWRLISLEGNIPVEGTELTLDFFPDSYLEGDAGCNRYGSNYLLNGDSFRLSVIHRTDLACDVAEGVHRQEAAYLDALARAAAVRYWVDRLELADAAGRIILVFAPVLPATVDPALVDTEWVLTLLHNESPLPRWRITLNVDQEGLGGFAGCNQYGGEVEAADGGVLKSGMIWRTAAGCETAALQEQEEAYMAALGEAASYRMLDERLEIGNDRGETILEFARKMEMDLDPADLVGTVWRLVKMGGQEWSGGDAATLAFPSQHLAGGHGGCEEYVATYEASGDDLRFLYLGMLGSSCEDALQMAQQGDYTTLLGGTTDYRVGPDRLELETMRGQVLLFAPLPEGSHSDLEGPAWSFLAFIESEGWEGETEVVPVSMPFLGTRITAQFAGGNLSGSAGCNNYGAPYRSSGLSISLGALAATEMECPGPAGVMEQERRYLETLRTVTGRRVYGRQLWLQTEDGRRLVYRAGE